MTRMPMRRRSIAVRSALVTTRDLVGGVIVSGALGAVIDAAGTSHPRVARVFAVLVATLVLVKSVGTWANDIAILDGGSRSPAAARIAVLSLVPAVIVV